MTIFIPSFRAAIILGYVALPPLFLLTIVSILYLSKISCSFSKLKGPRSLIIKPGGTIASASGGSIIRIKNQISAKFAKVAISCLPIVKNTRWD